jgi:cytidyltransferase-like protein
MPRVLVYGGFDDLRSRDVRFLQEASRLGEVHALVWSDTALRDVTGKPPTFPAAERMYLLQSSRWVASAAVTGDSIDPDSPPRDAPAHDLWAVTEREDSPGRRDAALARGTRYHVIAAREIEGFPEQEAGQTHASGMAVVVTGCFDWVHSGHVRFFEEASALGALHVVVGGDANLRLLKGKGHPLFSQEERMYRVRSVRFVTAAHLATGSGWLDAEPEILRIRPGAYVVNTDGDRPEKRAFCRENGIRYVVLKRAPRPGLPPRTSTDLRGF